MRCPDVVERLPELLSGGMPAAEGEAIEAHLASCEACSRERSETLLAAALFDTHLSSGDLVALAWGRGPDGVDPGLARRHLALCRECADSLDLARESRAAESGVAVRNAPWSRLRWPLPQFAAAIAMAAIAAGALSGLVSQRARLATAHAERDAALERLSRAESALRTARNAGASLRAEVQKAVSPQINVPLLELLPTSTRTREAAPTGDSVIEVGPDDAFVALLLVAPPLGRNLRADLRDESGKSLWTGEGLQPSASGGYSVALPTQLLPDGRYSILLSPAAGRDGAATFRFLVRRPR